MPRQTRPRQRPQLLYSRDRGGRASPPAPEARGQIGTLVSQVSASPPPRLFLLGGTGWRPPIQPGQRRRRRRQRQQVSRVPKAPARPTWSSPTERYGAREGTSAPSGRHMRARAVAPERRSAEGGAGIWGAQTHCAQGEAQSPAPALVRALHRRTPGRPLCEVTRGRWSPVARLAGPPRSVSVGHGRRNRQGTCRGP